MRRDFFTFRPTFKLTVTGNHKPGLRAVDAAARRRFNLVPFVHKPAKPDRQLEQKLTAEWPAILRWMITGCLEWQASGLITPQVIDVSTAEYFADQDLFGIWMDDRCVIQVGNSTLKSTTSELFASWAAFAKESNADIGTSNTFSDRLKTKGCLQLKNVPKPSGGRARGFSGIVLRTLDNIGFGGADEAP